VLYSFVTTAWTFSENRSTAHMPLQLSEICAPRVLSHVTSLNCVPSRTEESNISCVETLLVPPAPLSLCSATLEKLKNGTSGQECLMIGFNWEQRTGLV
jgi:hypothetical protein